MFCKYNRGVANPAVVFLNVQFDSVLFRKY